MEIKSEAGLAADQKLQESNRMLMHRFHEVDSYDTDPEYLEILGPLAEAQKHAASANPDEAEVLNACAHHLRAKVYFSQARSQFHLNSDDADENEQRYLPLSLAEHRKAIELNPRPDYKMSYAAALLATLTDEAGAEAFKIWEDVANSDDPVMAQAARERLGPIPGLRYPSSNDPDADSQSDVTPGPPPVIVPPPLRS